MTRRILLFFAVVLSAFTVLSCVEEKVSLKPEIKLSETELSLDPSGAKEKVVCIVENPVEGQSVDVRCDADWLEVTVSRSGRITLIAAKNETGSERTASVTVSYPGAADVALNVVQPAWIVPIVITVTDVQSTSISFSVSTSEKDFPWVGQIVAKDWFESMESDDDIFDEDYSYYTYAAADAGISLADYLKKITNKGSCENLVYPGLDPSSEYVVYAYGITADGERTTDIYHADAVTLPPYDGPLTFEIGMEENNHVLDILITPSHDGVAFYWDIVEKETFDSWEGELTAAIQSNIDSRLNEYIEYGEVSSASEFYEWFSSVGIQNSSYECLASTEYVIFASKWNEDCKLVGDVECVTYTSMPVSASANEIVLTVANATQSTFDVSTTTTNNDPYVVLAEPTAICGWDAMTDDEVFDYILTNYGTWYITDYICEGNLTDARFYDLNVDTEYTVIAFGYEAGVRTTDVKREKISTLASASPSDYDFAFTVSDIKSTSVYASVSPSEDGYYYYWWVYEAEATADDVKEDIRYTIDKLCWGDMDEFRYSYLNRGSAGGNVSYLAPETEYKVGAVIVDEKTGECVADVVFSEVFTTGKMIYANVDLHLVSNKYYDGTLLAAAVEDLYAQYDGYALLPVTLYIEGDYKEYYYTVFSYQEGLENPNVFPDSKLYSSLVSTGVYYAENVNFRAEWDVPLVLAAVAIDHDGNYSRVFRKKITLTREGASPIEDLIGSATKASSSSDGLPVLTPESARVQVQYDRKGAGRMFRSASARK